MMMGDEAKRRRNDIVLVKIYMDMVSLVKHKKRWAVYSNGTILTAPILGNVVEQLKGQENQHSKEYFIQSLQGLWPLSHSLPKARCIITASIIMAVGMHVVREQKDKVDDKTRKAQGRLCRRR